MFEIEGKFATATVFADDLERTAIAQVERLCDQPFAEGSRIALMPDAHAGSGCVIGTTMTAHGAIVPNLVGVDISCGVMAARLDAEAVDFAELDSTIRSRVPSGFAIRGEIHPLAEDIPLEELSCAEIVDPAKWRKAVGTLGGGNHFIEVDRDADGGFWLVVHSGSRNPGLQVALHHQKKAQALHPEAGELAWLEGAGFDAYVHDMGIMQRFADMNRKAILAEIMVGMGWGAKEWISTTHNYLDTESMILRKGAVSARAGERFLLPMNMRDGTFVCVGKGNPEWNCSAPHGAGRLMSRGEARRSLSLDDMKCQMEGIWTTSVCDGTLDEAPDAYKPMTGILAAIGPTAEIAAALKPVYNFKADGPDGRRRRKGGRA